ncbi:hypothetical protein ABB37_07113 [Leptomonas pyrrhocoris]|uniref:U3 small nucleolar RNA-associated protein 25 n=1 Tax=Leptomonas pyrrhocoris TaxID=157538 RepID=A0A0M9FW60_LEPPY|nr:hypothetical protein ABB37_07113 [Leptomonas pyrrhocoris]KPA77199.1 hypothetical protein ABB37_07113 [Leptomonas pyrrhocoris]|eukprot:XP_015655638.1 hypothetical protein ABB37_07113 [Leptomonas pyrrhocoris]
MGRSGGFFKKLKAKQKKAASRQQRGTKGASKEDRRRKHNERVEVYAAKREAEQLAVVSSSSDEASSTDSETEAWRETRSMRKLRAMLGAGPTSANKKTSLHAAVEARKRTRRGEGGADSRDDAFDGEAKEEEDDDDGWNSSDSEAAAAAQVATRRPPQRRRLRRGQRGEQRSEGTTNGDDGDDELDAEDWRLYLGQGSSSGDDSLSAEEGEEVGEEDQELGETTADADDVVDKDLLMDINETDDEVDEEGDDEEEGDGDNPLFHLDDEDASNGVLQDGEGDEEEDDGADLFDDAMMYDDAEAEEEEEEEEEEREDALIDEDEEGDEVSSDDDDADNNGGGATTPKKGTERGGTKQKSAEQHQLLQTFQFNTSSVSVLQQHGSVLSEADAWVRKYHLDLHGGVDETPLKPLPVPHAAVELLAASNEPLKKRAATLMDTTEDKKQLGIFFVSAEEYNTLHPENVAVLATAHVQQHLLHAPFDVAAAAVTQLPAYLHPALWAKWTAFRGHKNLPNFTAEERGLLDLLQGYPDVFDALHCWQNSESRREVYALHLLNHWFKARSVVVAHDALLAQRKQAQRARRRQQWARRKQQQQPQKAAAEPAVEDNDEEEEEEEPELRDRGFSKTRLCVMCPLRNHAYKFVYTLVSILQADPEKCPKLAMFEQDFTEIEETLDPTFKRRPREYQRAFEGNIDDSFCVGLRLEPERVHLYAHPLNSDLLICSPLGLRRRIEKNGDVLVSLSSIEVCLLTEAQMLYQQNWMHVAAVLELLDKRPTDTTHGLSDLRRVYAWALEGRSGRHRQTIVATEVSTATMLSTFRTSSVNNSGKVVLQRRADPGVLARVLVPVRQHFIRFEPTSLSTVDEDRFEFFTKQVYEAKINAMAERDVRIIIFVPSYFDFVRVRNYLHREYRESYAALSEYTSLKQQRKALGQFSDLERPVLLVTERFYFFKRYFVKMAEALVFYGPPMFPEYYASLTNRLVATSPNAFTMTLYCRYDTHELNRLVGTSRMVQLLERESGVFSFVTS